MIDDGPGAAQRWMLHTPTRTPYTANSASPHPKAPPAGTWNAPKGGPGEWGAGSPP